MRKSFLFLIIILLAVFVLTNSFALVDDIPETADSEAEMLVEQKHEQALREKIPPEISFTPVTRAKSNQLVTIKARITDDNKVGVAKLFYRYADRNEFSAGVPFVLVDKAKNIYQASFPVKDQNVFYYVEVIDVDNNGPVHKGPYQLFVGGADVRAASSSPVSVKDLARGESNYFILVLLLVALVGLIVGIIYLVVKNKR